MEAKPYLSKEDFIQKFKLSYALAVRDDAVMATYESYSMAIAKLRRDCVQYLRSVGVPGQLRSKYNDSIQRLAETSHRKYLFHKDPTCGICGFLIERIEDATIDHIHPRSKGGANAFENKQIAHGACNVKKSNKVGFTMKKPGLR